MCAAQSMVWARCVVSGPPKRIRAMVRNGVARSKVRSSARTDCCGGPIMKSALYIVDVRNWGWSSVQHTIILAPRAEFLGGEGRLVGRDLESALCRIVRRLERRPNVGRHIVI